MRFFTSKTYLMVLSIVTIFTASHADPATLNFCLEDCEADFNNVHHESSPPLHSTALPTALNSSDEHLSAHVDCIHECIEDELDEQFEILFEDAPELLELLKAAWTEAALVPMPEFLFQQAPDFAEAMKRVRGELDEVVSVDDLARKNSSEQHGDQTRVLATRRQLLL